MLISTDLSSLNHNHKRYLINFIMTIVGRPRFISYQINMRHLMYLKSLKHLLKKKLVILFVAYVLIEVENSPRWSLINFAAQME